MIQNYFFEKNNYNKNYIFFKKSKKVLIHFSKFLKNKRFFDKSLKKNFKLQLFFLLSNPFAKRNINVFKKSRSINSMLIQNRTNFKKPIDFFRISYKKNQLVKSLKNIDLKLSPIKTKNKIRIKYELLMLMKKVNKNKLSQIWTQKIINKLFSPIFQRFFLLKAYQHYLMLQVIKNINNIPYGILIVCINQYSRFWKIFRIIFSIFIFLSKVSTANFIFKIINLISNEKLEPNRPYKLISSKLWELKSDLFESTIKKYFTYLINFSKKRIQQFLSKESYFFSNDLKKLMLHFLHIKKYKLKIKDSKLLNSFFNSSVFRKSQSRFQKALKSGLWKSHKKSHNQNSFKWVFKKYWININLYKKWPLTRSGFIAILKTQKLISFKNNLMWIDFTKLKDRELLSLLLLEIFALLLKRKIKALNFELNINYKNLSQLLNNKVTGYSSKNQKPIILYTYSINDLA